jgi:bacterial/archaeal transporter family protein
MTAFWWAVLAASMWGVAPMLEKAGLAQAQPMAGLFYRCVGVMIGMVLVGTVLVKPEEIKSVDMRSAAFLVAGGFLASIMGQIFFYRALKAGEISKMVLVAGSYPVITFLIGIFFMNESLTLQKALGAFLVMAGLIFLKIG